MTNVTRHRPAEAAQGTREELQRQRQESCAFARQHLRECSQELLEWRDTGVLRDGKVRELATLCRAWCGSHELSIAEDIVRHEALKHCAA